MSDRDNQQPSSTSDPAPAQRGSRTRVLKTALLYGVVVAFAAWCLVEFRQDISQISLKPVIEAPGVVALVLALSLANYALRGIRWRMYVQRLGYSIPVGYGILTFVAGFAFTLSPAKAGEMVRARYYPGLPISSVAAACFVERLIDLLVMTTLAISVSAVFPQASWLMWAAAGGIAVALVVLAAIPWQSASDRVASSSKPAGKLRKAFGAVIETLSRSRTLLTPGLIAFSFALGMASWGAEGLGLKVLSEMTPDATLSLQAAVGIYAVAITVGALSFLPAGLGSTEAVMAALLVAHGFKLPDALLLTLVCRIATLWFAIGLGWVAMLGLRGVRMPTRATT